MKTNLHPTEKPLEVSKRIIQSNNSNGLVYIPFAGSGSEIVSCIKNDRDWVATETNSTYIKDIIKPRIEEVQKVV